MIHAFLYLQACSLKNRLLGQLRRLKKPKYLLGTLAGMAYFYFLLFHVFGRSGMSRSADAAGVVFWEFGGALLLFAVVAAGWIFTKDRAALDFTEAEIAFLFPAPFTRRTLIHYKLLKTLVAGFFGALLMALMFGRRSGEGGFLRYLMAWWLMTSTLHLHGLASSFTQTRWMDRGMTSTRKRLLGLGLLVLVLSLVIVGLKLSPPPAPISLDSSQQELASFIETLMGEGVLLVILFPFRLLIHPFFATGFTGILMSWIPVLGMMALHYWWVMRADVAFEEASLVKARKVAAMIENIRQRGVYGAAQKRKRHHGTPFPLPCKGPPFVALFWKNLIAISSTFSLRFWFGLGTVMLLGLVVWRWSAPDSAMLMALSVIPFGLGAMSFFMGAQVLRQDLRSDMPAVDLLKSFPMPGWQVVLGEVLAPVAVLTSLHWLLLFAGLLLLPGTADGMHVGVAMKVGIGISVAAALPFLNLTLFLINNGVLLAFPGWITTGSRRPAGFEATGQQMILALVQLFAMLACVLPVVLVVGGGWFVGSLWFSAPVLLPVIGLAGILTIACEIAAGLWFLGQLFERFDLSAEPVD